jgi:hypothetical protein
MGSKGKFPLERWIWERADEEKNLLARGRRSLGETIRLMNEQIPRHRWVTSADVHSDGRKGGGSSRELSQAGMLPARCAAIVSGLLGSPEIDSQRSANGQWGAADQTGLFLLEPVAENRTAQPGVCHRPFRCRT